MSVGLALAAAKASTSGRGRGKQPWNVFVYYRGFDPHLDELLRKLLGEKHHVGSGTTIATMERDHQFEFPSEQAARKASARIPWWLRVRAKIARVPTDAELDRRYRATLKRKARVHKPRKPR